MVLADDASFAEASAYRDDFGAELTPDQMTDAKAKLAAWSPDEKACVVVRQECFAGSLRS